MNYPARTGPYLDWGRLDRQERGRAYDNTSAVADVATWRQARTDASLALRAARPGALDLPYGPGERNKWDLFPAERPDAPCLVFIHGGYWQMNTRETFGAVTDGVRAHGWAAALPGYTLAPEASLASIVAEIDAALDWLATNGRAHGIAGPVVVSGWSAGGHLAAMALAHRHVVAGLAISGIYDLGPISDTYLNDKLSLTADEVATLSPLRLPVVSKPLAIAYGSAELPALIADSRDLHAYRSLQHAPGPLVPVAGAHHFAVLDALREAGGELTRTALALMP